MNNRGWLVGSCVAGVLSMLAGCGGGGSSVECGTFMACGGDLAGTWNIEGTCGVEEQTDENCPTATITSSVDLSGSVTFGADGAYSAHNSATGNVSVTYPASCLMNFQITSCEMLQQQLQQAIPGATCTGTATTSCTCKIPVNDTTDETGTFTTSGNVATITTTGAGGGTTMVEYCVSGSTLKAREQGSTAFIVFSK